MGVYDSVFIEQGDNEKSALLEVQFKWGDCWLHRYRVGDKIKPLPHQKGSLIIPGLSNDGFFSIRLVDWQIMDVTEINQSDWNVLDVEVHQEKYG